MDTSCLCPAARAELHEAFVPFTTRSTTRLPARASRSRSAGLTDASKSQCPTMGRGWIRGARAPSRVSSVSARTGRRPHRRVRACLAIARAYARRNDGDIELRDGEPNGQEASAWHRYGAAAGAMTVSPYPHQIELKGDRSSLLLLFSFSFQWAGFRAQGLPLDSGARQRRESGFAACLRNPTSSLQQWAGRRAFRAASRATGTGPA